MEASRSLNNALGRRLFVDEGFTGKYPSFRSLLSAAKICQGSNANLPSPNLSHYIDSEEQCIADRKEEEGIRRAMEVTGNLCRMLCECLPNVSAPRLEDQSTEGPKITIESCEEKEYSVVGVRCKNETKLFLDIVCTLSDMQYVIFRCTFSSDSDGTYASQEYFIQHMDGSTIDTEEEKERIIKCIEAAIQRRVSEARNEHSVFSPAHCVVTIMDDHEVPVKQDTRKYGLWAMFRQLLCSESMFCPPDHRATLAGTFYGLQISQIWALGNPLDLLSPSTNVVTDVSHTTLSFNQAFVKFFPSIIWSGMFMLSFAYTAKLVLSLPFRVPILSMLLLGLVYYMSVLAFTLSGFHIALFSSFRISGLLFTMVGALGFVIIVVLLASSCIIMAKKEDQVTLSE